MKLKNIPVRLFHSHYLTDATFFRPLTKNYNVPKICSGYGYDVSSFPKRLGVFAHLFFRNIFSEYTYFLAMSEDMKSDIIALGCPPGKVIVHYHGIDTAFFDVNRTLRQPNGEFNILTIGRLTERKGHIVSLRAIQVLKSLLPDVKVKYTIVGDGPLKSSLLSFVDSNGLSGTVKFCERVPHGQAFINYLRDAHVFLHPSNITVSGGQEGIPGTIVEAMASGLPVVSTVHAGIPEVIHHDESGFLVREKDYVGIARYLKLLYENTELALDIGRRAKEYARRNLDFHQRAIELQAIYRSTIAHHNVN